MTDKEFIRAIREAIRIELNREKGGKIIVKEEPVHEAEACKYLGIKRQTMRQYVCEGKMQGTYVINILGKRMFYKSKFIIK